ncbi:MAG TPA: nitroreductase/quinone reductase family protein [Thermomicrobiales bacterium]|nr:nitroreductase/quinone reductase family protein [Thermomicrobiales bacterium]
MTSLPHDILDLAAREREVDLTTFGRKTGTPSRRTLWVWGDGARLYIRSGGGLGRDWPQNLLANGRAVLHLAGRDIPVHARHVTDETEARQGADFIKRKYHSNVRQSAMGEPLTPAEQATFELLPDDVQGAE